MMGVDWRLRVRGVPGARHLADLVRFAAHPADQAAIWRDLRRTREEMRFIREARFAQRPGRVALILSMTNSVYSLKLEAMLATGLRQDGWHIVVLTSALYGWARRYFDCFGIHDVVDFESVILDGDNQAEVARASRRLLDASRSFAEVKEWTYRDAWVGPHIFSLLSRMNLDGHPDLSDAAVRRQLRKLLPRSLRFAHIAEKLLARHRPTLLLVNEPNYAINGPVVDTAVAAGIDVIHFLHSGRDNALTFKRLTAATRRIHPSSLTPDNFARFLTDGWSNAKEAELQQEFAQRYGGGWFLTARNQDGVKAFDRDALCERLGLDPAKKIAVLFSHVLWDANLFYGDDLFDNYGVWFVDSVRAACANSNVNWLIKLHPANVWKRRQAGAQGELAEVSMIAREIGPLPPHVVLLRPETEIGTHSLFQAADYGVTVRGTVGIEMPCFGIPVLTAGTGRYSGLGFTHDFTSREDYLGALARIEQVPRLDGEAVMRAKVYAHALFRRRFWESRSFAHVVDRAAAEGPLKMNLRANVRSLAEMGACGDLAEWARFAADGEAIDFVNPGQSKR